MTQVKFLLAALLISVTGTIIAKTQKEFSVLKKEEKKAGWTVIFDGKTTKGWRGYTKTSFPEKGWDIVDGSLHCCAKGGGGDLIFDKKLTNFELVLNWKISKAGNSGIFIFAKEVPGNPIYYSAPEYQILDNERHPDAKAGKNGNRKSASLYDMIAANPQNAKPAGEWNEARIVALNGNVEYWQNGVKVVQFQIGSENWKKLCAESKFKNWPDFVNNPAKDGYIGVQDHGNDVWYKDIKLKVLK